MSDGLIFAAALKRRAAVPLRHQVLRWFPLTVLLASGLHLDWALGLFMDPASKNATAVHALLILSSVPWHAGLILVFVACSAIVGGALHERFGPWRAILMLPQMGVLALSSQSAIGAMVARSFADGVLRPFWFINVDQVPIVAIAVCYLIALSRVMRDFEEWPATTTEK